MLTIRPAAASDADTLATLLAQLGYQASATSIPARLDALQREGGIALVATTEQGRVVGAASAATHATLHADHPTGYITALVTDDTVRRQGVGRQLVAALEQWARDRGCHRLSVTSAEHRADAHAFYPRLRLSLLGPALHEDAARPSLLAIMALVRSIVGVILGYVVFALSAALLFGLSGQKPHAPASVAFMTATVLYGIVFAALGAWVAGAVAGRRPAVHGSMVGLLIAVGAVLSLVYSGAGSTWSQWTALLLMAPAAVAAGYWRSTSRHGTRIARSMRA